MRKQRSPPENGAGKNGHVMAGRESPGNRRFFSGTLSVARPSSAGVFRSGANRSSRPPSHVVFVPGVIWLAVGC